MITMICVTCVPVTSRTGVADGFVREHPVRRAYFVSGAFFLDKTQAVYSCCIFSFNQSGKTSIDDTVDVGRFLAKGTEPFYGGRIFRFYDKRKRRPLAHRVSAHTNQQHGVARI